MSIYREILMEGRQPKFRLSTEKGVGCPYCGNDDVSLRQCRKLVFKVCEDCQSIFLCSDAYGLFTDPRFDEEIEADKPLTFEESLKEDRSKAVKEYEKKTMAELKRQYGKYHYAVHPLEIVLEKLPKIVSAEEGIQEMEEARKRKRPIFEDAYI